MNTNKIKTIFLGLLSLPLMDYILYELSKFLPGSMTAEFPTVVGDLPFILLYFFPHISVLYFVIGIYILILFAVAKWVSRKALKVIFIVLVSAVLLTVIESYFTKWQQVKFKQQIQSETELLSTQASQAFQIKNYTSVPSSILFRKDIHFTLQIDKQYIPSHYTDFTVIISKGEFDIVTHVLYLNQEKVIVEIVDAPQEKYDELRIEAFGSGINYSFSVNEDSEDDEIIFVIKNSTAGSVNDEEIFRQSLTL